MQGDQSVLNELKLPMLSPDLTLFPDICNQLVDALDVFPLYRAHLLEYTWVKEKGPE